jgi:hypothetical protein
MHHRLLAGSLITLANATVSSHLLAAQPTRSIIAEIDALSPATAALDQENSQHRLSSNKWGASVDFNFGNKIATGPEIWTGNFVMSGPVNADDPVRREDFWYGEKQKINATRIQWNISRWEIPETMRGWYIKAAYSSLRIESKAHRNSEEIGKSADAVTVTGETNPEKDLDLVTDARHNAELGFGQRWMFAENQLSITLGATFSQNVKRSVSVDSNDSNARADYDEMIEKFPFTPLSTSRYPLISLKCGYAW